MAKHVCFFFVGTRGDVMPAIPICKALEVEGYKVTMALCPGSEDSVRAYGVRAVTVGKTPFCWRDETKNMTEAEVEIMRRSSDPRKWGEVERRHGVCFNLQLCIPDAIPDLAAFVDSHGVDALVVNACALEGGARVALHRNIPVIRTSFSAGHGSPSTAAFAPGGYKPSSLGFVNKLKHFHHTFACMMPALMNSSFMAECKSAVSKIEGIDQSESFNFFQRVQEMPMLGLWSEHIVPRPHDFPDNVRVTGAVMTLQLEGWQPSPVLEAFMAKRDADGRAPVVVTFGSMMGTGRVEAAVVQAARKIGMNVVLCSDKKRQSGADTTDFGFSAVGAEQCQEEECVFRAAYVPHDWLMPRASLTVNHGGAGTMQRSLWAGVPCVICPQITPLICDQTFHAQLVESKGLGAWLAPLYPTVEECEEALLMALECSAACQSLSAKLQAEEGACKAASAIHDILKQEAADKEAKEHRRQGRRASASGCWIPQLCAAVE